MVRLSLFSLFSWIVCAHSIHTLVKNRANIIKPKKEIQIFRNSAKNVNQIEIRQSQHLERHAQIRSPIGIIDRPNVGVGRRRVLRRGPDAFSSPLGYTLPRPFERNLNRMPLRSQGRSRTSPLHYESQYRRQALINLSRRQDRNIYRDGLRRSENHDNRNRHSVFDRLPTTRGFRVEPGRNEIYRLDTSNELLLLDSRTNNNRETRNNQGRERIATLHRPSAYRLENDPTNDLVNILNKDLPPLSLSQRTLPRAKVPVIARSQPRKEKSAVISDEIVTRAIPIPIPRRIPLRNSRQPEKQTTKLQKNLKAITPLELEQATYQLKTARPIPKPSDIVPLVTSAPSRQMKEQWLSQIQSEHANAPENGKGTLNSIAMLSPDPAIQAALKILAPLLTRAVARPMRPTEVINSISPKRRTTEKPLNMKESLKATNLQPPERKIKVNQGDPDFKVKPSNSIIQQIKSDSIVLKQGFTNMLESATIDRPSIETTLLRRQVPSKAPAVNILSDTRMKKDKPTAPMLDLSQLQARSRQRSVFYGVEMEEIPGFGQGLRGTDGMIDLSRLQSFYSSNNEAEENPQPNSFPNTTSVPDLLRYFRSIGIEEIGPEMFNQGKGGYPENSMLMGRVSRDRNIQLNEKTMGESEIPEIFANMYTNSNVKQRKELENIQNTDTFKTTQHVRFIQMGEELVPVPVGNDPKTTDSAKEIYNIDKNQLKSASDGTKLDPLLRAQSSVLKANIEEKVDISVNRDKKGANLQNIPTADIIKMLIRELTKMIV